MRINSGVSQVRCGTEVSATLQGFAYLEFLEADAINSALLLDGSELHGRQIKVGRRFLLSPSLQSSESAVDAAGRERTLS